MAAHAKKEGGKEKKHHLQPWQSRSMFLHNLNYEKLLFDAGPVKENCDWIAFSLCMHNSSILEDVVVSQFPVPPPPNLPAVTSKPARESRMKPGHFQQNSPIRSSKWSWNRGLDLKYRHDLAGGEWKGYERLEEVGAGFRPVGFDRTEGRTD
jgi:hypothetical protein